LREIFNFEESKYIHMTLGGFSVNVHIFTLVVIMIISGAFGGYLNYLHCFDMNAEDQNKRKTLKYILLGIGATFLVPTFLNMIRSDLIKETEPFDNNNYLIFTGFCLIASIFSRRFITTIGEKILETARKAEQTSNETKQEVENQKIELTTTQERVKDVKLSVDLNNSLSPQPLSDESFKLNLISLADSYVEKTSIPDYAERLRVKAEIGRQMGQIIISHNFSKKELLDSYPKEGMFLGIAYSIQLRPDKESLAILNELGKKVQQLYTKYVILLAYKTLATTGFIGKEEVNEVLSTIKRFSNGADAPLLRNIDDAIRVLRFVNQDIG